MTTASTNIIAQIGKGIVTAWDDVESWFATAVAKVNAVFPGAAVIETQVVSAAKQGASDILSDVGNGLLTPEETALVAGIDTLATTALTAATGGVPTPLNQMSTNYINGVVSKGYAALQAWALSQSAVLAENNAALQGGTPAQPAPQA